MPKGRPWTAEEDERLREMVLDGLDYRIIARNLERSIFACRLRASGRGLRKDRAAVLRNRKRGRELFLKSPTRVQRWKQRLVESFTPQAREILAEEARLRNLAGTFGVRKHRPETKAKISAAHKGRKFTAEHRRKISEGRSRYWLLRRAGVPSLDAYRAAMSGIRGKIVDELEFTAPVLAWCAQCERQVRPDEASACQSRYCKAKAVA